MPGEFYAVQATIGDTTELLSEFSIATEAFDARLFYIYDNDGPLVFPAVPDMDLILQFWVRNVASNLGLPRDAYTYTLEVVERSDLALIGGPQDDILSFDLAQWPGPSAVGGGGGTDTFTLAELPAGVLVAQPAFTIQGSEFGPSFLRYGIDRGPSQQDIDAIVYFDSVEIFQGSDFYDRFHVWNGTDLRIEGGGGSDQIVVSGGGTNRVFDGGAHPENRWDWLEYASLIEGEGVSLSLLDGVGLSGAAAGDVIIGFERVEGTDYNDTLIGGNGDESIVGGTGADILIGNGGNDTLIGGDRRDRGPVDDIAIFNFDLADYTITEIPTQLPNPNYEVAHSGSDGTDLLLGVEIFRFADGDFFPGGVTGTAGNDWIVWDARTFRVDGAEGTDMLSFVDAAGRVEVAAGLGFAHVDVPRNAPERDAFLRLFDIEGITGGRFDDLLRGGDGPERLRGLAGDDLFIGSAGSDTIEGGSGLDELRYIDSGSGVYASMLRGKGWAGDAAGDVFSGTEYLSGSRFSDTLAGSHGDDTLFGSHGDDLLIGIGGDDYLNRHVGTDTAWFSYARDQYTVTTTGLRTVVEYIGPGTGDGTDTLDHIEILRFADGDVIL